ncbi:uncharacterized protein PgNI_07585 [Pyricularia grisea]|uniref:Uncharacterized protein n=1 Tax=Pyricularia grisea TaxID=148305 RepID=A0A6P8B1D4_PYRGI|nr:uncharacterized protein PgNI_07585 [Pyricularia grisea]TLD08639.1 hypothetical protein PgNI_07585 [Pyricularia grisea]
MVTAPHQNNLSLDIQQATSDRSAGIKHSAPKPRHCPHYVHCLHYTTWGQAHFDYVSTDYALLMFFSTEQKNPTMEGSESAAKRMQGPYQSPGQSHGQPKDSHRRHGITHHCI